MQSTYIFLILIATSIENFTLAGHIELIPSNGMELQKSVTNCVVRIAKTYFPNLSNIGMITTNYHNVTNYNLILNSDNVLVAALMKELQWNIVMKAAAKSVEIDLMAMEKIHNYIVVVKTEAEVRDTLKMLASTSSWNPHAKFLIFVDWLERDWFAFTHFIFEQFWSYFVINVLICIPPNHLEAKLKVCDAITQGQKTKSITHKSL